MALSSLWQSGGWEHGYPRCHVGDSQDDNAAYNSIMWKNGGSSDGAVTSPSPRTGRYCTRPAPAGFGLATLFTGHYVARTDGFVFWVVPVLMSGWTGGSRSSGDDYVFARFVNNWNGSGSQYLGLGCAIVDATAGTWRFSLQLYNAVGTLNTAEVLNGAAVRTPSSSLWYFVLVEQEISTRITKIYVDGSQDGGSYTAPAGVYQNACILPDNRFLSGKGNEANPRWAFDDWGAWQGSVAADRPASAQCEQRLYQPVGDLLTPWTPSGIGSHYQHVDNERTGAACEAGDDYVTPGAASQRETWDIGDDPDPGASAAPLHVTLAWAEERTGGGATPHSPVAKLSGDASYDTSLGKGTGGPTGGTYCWAGSQMPTAPNANGAWNVTKLNQLQAGLDSIDTVRVEEFYAIACGANLTQPPANSCPAAAGRRRFACVA